MSLNVKNGDILMYDNSPDMLLCVVQHRIGDSSIQVHDYPTDYTAYVSPSTRTFHFSDEIKHLSHFQDWKSDLEGYTKIVRNESDLPRHGCTCTTCIEARRLIQLSSEEDSQ